LIVLNAIKIIAKVKLLEGQFSQEKQLKKDYLRGYQRAQMIAPLEAQIAILEEQQKLVLKSEKTCSKLFIYRKIRDIAKKTGVKIEKITTRRKYVTKLFLIKTSINVDRANTVVCGDIIKIRHFLNLLSHEAAFFIVENKLTMSKPYLSEVHFVILC
jgi:hypothetical protein